MIRKLLRLTLIPLSLIAWGWLGLDASALEPQGPLSQDPYSVIDAVNALRLSQGLVPYTVNSALMSVAQGQAEYMAATGNITHTGPDGSRPYQRGMAAGYPLAGQIPPGFYSENILGGPGITPQGAVQIWTGDDPHMHTMNSDMLQEIGAGVAVSGGMVYYVIDCARPTTSGLPQAYTPGVAESAFSLSNEIIVPVSKSTPDAEGKVFHEVQAGQSLWQIAIEYGVKIDQIRALNGLSPEFLIEPGQKLLVMTVGTPTPQPATSTPESSATPSAQPSPKATEEPTVTATPTQKPLNLPVSGAEGAVAAIIVVALVAAALVAWAGRARPI